ncbi:MAG: hypothetical protein FJ297_04380 [Planctomycetes bacterium]|nr:hypothetical protein [Planctomycetota bacterium]
MADELNPYRDWLGIDASIVDPDYYQLLGVDPDEPDSERIRAAADRALIRVRSFRPGPHAARWAELLDALKQVKLELTDPTARAAYNALLERSPRQATVGRAPSRAMPGESRRSDPIAASRSPTASRPDDLETDCRSRRPAPMSSEVEFTAVEDSHDPMATVAFDHAPAVDPMAPIGFEPAPASDPMAPIGFEPAPASDPMAPIGFEPAPASDPMAPIDFEPAPASDPMAPIDFEPAPASDPMAAIEHVGRVEGGMPAHKSAERRSAAPESRLSASISRPPRHSMAPIFAAFACGVVLGGLVTAAAFKTVWTPKDTGPRDGDVAAVSARSKAAGRGDAAPKEPDASHAGLSPRSNPEGSEDGLAMAGKGAADPSVDPVADRPASPRNAPTSGTLSKLEAGPSPFLMPGESTDLMPALPSLGPFFEPKSGASPETPPARDPTGGSAMPASPDTVRQVAEILDGARAAMSRHAFDESAAQLTKAESIASNEALRDDVARHRRFEQRMRAFRSAVERGMAKLEAGATLNVGDDEVVAIVERKADSIIIRAAGQNRTYALNQLPIALGLALADQGLDTSPESVAVKGAYQYLHPEATDAQRAEGLGWMGEEQ